jgi:hypothetical protein
MNLDKLISKYIDGELSIKEDLILRELIANDKDAKAAFDSDINLHYLLQNDAKSIEVPSKFNGFNDILFKDQIEENNLLDINFNLRSLLIADKLSIDLPQKLETQTEDLVLDKIYNSNLINSDFELSKKLKEDANSIVLPVKLESETEDLVLMNIFQANPLVSKITINKIEKFNFRYISIAASLLLFFSFSFISESLKISLSQIASKKIASKEVNFNGNIINSGNKNLTRKSNFVRTIENKPLLNDSEFEISQITANSEAPLNEILAINNSSINNSSLNELEQNNNLILNNNEIINELPKENINIKSHENINKSNIATNQNINSFVNNPILNSNNFNIPISPAVIKDIEMTTTFGASQFNDQFENIKNLSSQKYAQSIAYFLDENQKFGIEIGFNEFNYLAHTIIKVPITGLGNDKGGSKILQPVGGDDRFINVDVDANRNTSSFWGSMFYERNLFDVKDINFTTRVGFGTSMNGVLAYNRFSARYKIFDLVYITAGIEGAISTLDLPEIKNPTDKMNKSLTLLYGFQIKF